MPHINELGQTTGDPVENWKARSIPPPTPLQGRRCRLEPLDCERHARSLYDAFLKDDDHRNWTYLGVGPFADFENFHQWLLENETWEDPLFHAVVDSNSRQALGLAAYLRINPADGVIEVGHIHFSPLLQGTTMATEAIFLLMKQVFDELGYRRYEWKCDALNAASRRAALRFGFSYEGIFRQAMLYKKRNRDTAWYAMIDKEWPAIRSAYESWLEPSNFSADGAQIVSLSEIMSKTRRC